MSCVSFLTLCMWLTLFSCNCDLVLFNFFIHLSSLHLEHVVSLLKLDIDYCMDGLLFLRSELVMFIRCQRIVTKMIFNLFYRGRNAQGRAPDSRVWNSPSIRMWGMASFFPFRCPLVSLSYIPRAASAVFPYGGVLAGTLENATFWERKTGSSHQPHVLPIEPGGCIDFQTESSTRHCLVTYRPGEFYVFCLLLTSLKRKAPVKAAM